MRRERQEDLELGMAPYFYKVKRGYAWGRYIQGWAWKLGYKYRDPETEDGIDKARFRSEEKLRDANKWFDQGQVEGSINYGDRLDLVFNKGGAKAVRVWQDCENVYHFFPLELNENNEWKTVRYKLRIVEGWERVVKMVNDYLCHNRWPSLSTCTIEPNSEVAYYKRLSWEEETVLMDERQKVYDAMEGKEEIKGAECK